MLRTLKILPLTFALMAFGVFATSCGTDHTQVRFVHAFGVDGVTEPPNVDVAVDGKTVVTDLAFGNVSPASGYLTVTAGNRRVEVRDTRTTTDRINSTPSFSSGKQYTIIASGFVVPPAGSDPNLVGIAGVVLTDDNSAPTSGNVKLRVVHASPGNGVPDDLDVYIVAPGTDISGMTPTIPSLTYGQASSYQDVPPTSNQVIFTLAGGKTPVINQTYTLTAGQIRTLVTVNVQGGLTMATTPLELFDLN
jgi:uncharacterized protein DUF4397